MSIPCHACEKGLDRCHDEFYYCPVCEEPPILYCNWCEPRDERCPVCGNNLELHRESITRRAFFNPATRGLLGF